MHDQGAFPADDLAAITRILATGHLRYRDRRRREKSLDMSADPSVHGHEVNGIEKGEAVGNRDTATT
jgi:hypothetical protein